VRRTTDTNRIAKQICHACLVLMAAVTLVTLPAGSCFAQAADAGLPNLPKGFRPPPPIPKEFTIEKPLITDDDVTAWKRKRAAFQEALSGKLAGDAPKVIDEGFRVVVQELSIVDRRDDLADLRKAVVRYVDQFVSDKNEDTKKFACKTIVKYATTLLDGNFHVRLQAVLLIGSLSVSPEVPGLRPKPAIAYIDGLPVLLDVIRAPEDGISQPEPVRILAAMGAMRLLQEGRQTLKPNSKLPVDAAKRMLAELTGNGTDWYHQRLIEAVIQTALATVPNDQNQQEPVIVEALARILSNPRRSNRLRARAARLLGRTAMPNGLQAAPIAFSIVKLTQKIATEVNQKRLPAAEALFLVHDIYLAFKPAYPGETTVDLRKGAGLLSTLNQQPTQAAYKDILPIAKLIFQQLQDAGNKPPQVVFPPSQVEKLNAWPKLGDMTLAPDRISIDIPLQKPAEATPRAAAPTANRDGKNVNKAG